MRHLTQKQSGFTLLEVMIVLAIIGGIMALVATNIVGSASDARVKTTQSQMKLIESALDMYKVDNFNYPTTEQGLEALISAPTSAPIPRNYRSGGYLRGNSVPTDAWGNAFLYFHDRGQFELISLGADGVEGGEGENADLSSLN